MVGRPDVSLREGADRCRMAIINSDLGWPATKRITVLLSPADLTKRGPHFDLAIAVAVLAADGTVPGRGARSAPPSSASSPSTAGCARCRGCCRWCWRRASAASGTCSCPSPRSREAAMVPGMTVLGMRSLAQVVAELRDEEVPVAPPVAPMSGTGC